MILVRRILILCLCVGIQSAYPQSSSKVLDCGRLLYTVDEDELIWPADFETRESLLRPRLYFAAENWTDADSNLHGLFIDRTLADISYKRTMRYPYPIMIIDGVDITEPPRLADYLDPNLDADQVVEVVRNSPIGITVTEKVHAFSHPYYQDFVITHYQLVNTGRIDEFNEVLLPGQTLTNFYFIDARGYNPGSELPSDYCAGSYGYWGDYYGDEPGEDLKLFYGWDGNDPKNEGQCGDDEGNPSPQTGAFTTPQYCGHGLIHADTSPQDRQHDTSQPVSLNRINAFTLNQLTESELFDRISDSNSVIMPVDPTGDPSVEQSPILLMGYGPYTMEFGDTLNFILFRGAGGLSSELCDSLGKAWRAGEITDEEKNTSLRTGFDSLKVAMHRAIDIWENGFKIPGGENLAPPDSFILSGGSGMIDLKWGPVVGAQFYNIFRALGDPDSVLFSIIATNVDSTNFTDKEVNKGYDYYYYVTAVDNHGIESSRYWLRTNRRNSSVVPTTALGRNTLEDVRVVPNPFVWNKEGNYPGNPDKIIFAGLPGPCDIRIYTISGDLVQHLEHSDITGIHEWDQITRFNQYIASGIYVYHVRDKSIGNEKFGKFIIIR